LPHIEKQMASFFITTKCSLACKYCYNMEERSQLKEQTLSFEMAKAGIDMFFNENKSRHIRFYGPGEPTQEIGIVKQIVEYAKLKTGDELTVELQTNGVFSESARKWLLDNVNIIWVSFDGEPYIHDALRCFPDGSPTSPIIEKNLKWLRDNKTNQKLMIGARVTITNENIECQIQMIDYFRSLGIEHIWSDPVFPSVGIIPVCDDAEKTSDFSFDMDKYVNNYIEAKKYADEIGVFYGSFLTCNFDGISNRHCRACTPTPHFTADGYISACDLAAFGENAHHMDCFVYGKWNKDTKSYDLWEDRIEMLQARSTDAMPHCRSCDARDYCGGYCLGEVMNETGSLFGQKAETCKAIRKLLSEIGVSNEPYPYFHP